MASPALGRTVGHGALAGAVAGGVGAAALAWLVEPSIRAAIRLEEAAAGGHGHDHAGDAGAHSHAGDALVSRPEQVVLGLATVLVVGTLIGVAFAVVHRILGDRLPGATPAGRAMALAGLGFAAFSLAPALVVPANPPAVGDAETVALRTVTYLGTIVCAVALTAAVVALARARSLGPAGRTGGATALAVAGAVVLRLVLPDAADAVPAQVPADLVWEFRVASLAQLGLMWLALGAVLAVLAGPVRVARGPRTARVPAPAAS